MNRKTIFLYVVFALILPQIILKFAMNEYHMDTDRLNDALIETAKTVSQDKQRIVRVYDKGDVLEVSLDTYVTGVVLAEMPSDFEPEALRAQAVACRTFTLRNLMHNAKHKDADVCTDPSCCQAYQSPPEFSGSSENLEKVKTASLDTAGEVITFQGNLIDATYFSCSGGQTEDALEVWGNDVPYLQSVPSPGEEISAKYETVESFTISEFKQRMGLPLDLVLGEEEIEISHTGGGGVDQMIIGDYSYTGVNVRNLLSLRSTLFSLEILDDRVLITTKGYGHRVGMSQYGAEVMALDGYSYREILRHYYTGTDVVKLSQEELDTIFDKAENF